MLAIDVGMARLLLDYYTSFIVFPCRGIEGSYACYEVWMGILTCCGFDGVWVLCSCHSLNDESNVQ
jgi:hypothetical protein